MKKNADASGWSRRYQAALRKHLDRRPGASLEPALRLGRAAVSLGLDTLDVARIHGQALLALVAPTGAVGASEKTIARAKGFFTETIVPIEKTHPAALKADVRVYRLTQTLRRRAEQSSASARHLKRGIVQRRTAEAALKKSGQHRSRLLQKAHRLQNHLRSQTRKMLSALEGGRQKTSRQLHDEIAQTLLAIHLRLLILKKSTEANTEYLEKEIAETQRVVRQSVNLIQRTVHEFGGEHETQVAGVAAALPDGSEPVP